MYGLNLLIGCLLLALSAASQAATPIYAGDNKQSQLYKQQLKNTLSVTGCKCLIAVGSAGLEAALAEQNASVIFATRISAARFIEIKSNYPDRLITAIYNEPDPKALIRLGQAIFGRYSLALFYSERSVHLNNQSEDVRYIQTSKSEIRQALSKLTEINALVVVPDSSIWNLHSFRNAVHSLYRQRKALIGFNKSLVKAGAIAGLYVDDETYNQQINGAITGYLKTGLVPGPAYPSSYKIEFNTQIARTLSIPLPQKEKLMKIVNERGSNE